MKRLYLFFLFSLGTISLMAAPTWLETVASGPNVLVLYDGANVSANPGRLDARYLGNLLGHFTTHRTIVSLDQYQSGDALKYDAVFTIIYDKQYHVPSAFLNDAARLRKPFCWLGHRAEQLDRVNFLKQHGLYFERFYEDSPARQVTYKGRTLAKGDPDTSLFRILDTARVRVLAETIGANGWEYPYLLNSGSFWLVTDSPFSYSGENDRYLVFADALHDILGIDHPEDHQALLRLEDLNPTSKPGDLRAMARVIRSKRIPFAFGFVPFYVNPTQHVFEQLSEKPEVVEELKALVAAGGQPVLHGDTHQYRGVTTDDYEFWDNIADRPVKRDSEEYAARRVEDALKESIAAGIHPLTWETPHYAGSSADYRAFKKIFNTTFERRLTSDKLGSDQFFPYPVVDLLGQYVIPENLGYIQEDNPIAGEILANADAAYVVRDGFASFFFHPFLKPGLLGEIIDGIRKRGYRFVGLPAFPNRVLAKGYLATNVSGDYVIGGEGRYLIETVVSASGHASSPKSTEAPLHGAIKQRVNVRPGETIVMYRNAVKPSNFIENIFRLAKGDVSALPEKFETIFAPNEFPEDRRVTLLVNEKAQGEEAVDQKSFDVMLEAIGYEVNTVPVQSLTDQELGKFSLLVVPAAAARKLPPHDVEAICKAVEQGIIVVTDGDSPLARALGFDLGPKLRVSRVTNHLFPTQELRWPDQPDVPWIQHLLPDADSVLFSDEEEGNALVVARSIGEGKVLFFGPYFDSLSGQGYSRFPDVPYLLVNEFRIRPLLRRAGAEAYFDPGYRQSISIEQLAKFWKRSGIRVIHAAAWHFYDKYAYDYERLVRVAHQNGILVYAWFEWPHVSQKFWDKHPEWREKNALLEDAHLDWRFLMNMQDPECFKAVMEDAETLLRKCDWDGVNIAEFHFESAKPEQKARFTPLNPNMRRLFQARYGFDPLELWNEGSPHSLTNDPAGLANFYSFRRSENQRLLKQILEEVQSLNKRPGKNIETVVTLFDVDGHPYLSDRLGIDSARSLALINEFGATLQVEDPAVEWAKPPQRYVALGERYRKMNLKKPFMIDINVLDVHSPNQPGFATNAQSGTELIQLWNSASQHASRVCLYSESTISESDWELLPYTMAANASVVREGDDWIVRTEDPVSLELSRPFKRVFMDDRPWFCYRDRSIFVPPGEHHITLQPNIKSWIDTSALSTRLISISGDLIGSEPRNRGLEVEYRSFGRCSLIFNKQPSKIYIDGTATKLVTLKGDDGYVVMAPSGQHRLRVLSDSPFVQVLNYTSVVAGSLIVLFGATSSGLLFIAFILIKLNRRTKPVRERIQRRVFRVPKKAT